MLAGRAFMSCSRTWCFPCTNTHNTRRHRLFHGSNRGPWGLQDSVRAQGHVAAPCRYTVRHIIEGETDDRRVMKETQGGKTQAGPAIHTFSSQVLRQRTIHSVHRLAQWRHIQWSQCTFSSLSRLLDWQSASSVFPHRMFGAMKSVKYTSTCMHVCDTQLSIFVHAVDQQQTFRSHFASCCDSVSLSCWNMNVFLPTVRRKLEKSKLFLRLRVCLCRYAYICQYEACVSFMRKTSRCRVLYICWKHFCGPPACA